MRLALARWSGSGALLAALLTGADALAHGAFPRVRELRFQPDDPGHAVLGLEGFGILHRTAQGEPFRFVCAQAFDMDAYHPQPKPLEILRGGTIALAAGFDGLQISLDRGCNFTEHPAFAGQFVPHVAASADGRILYVLSSTGVTTADGETRVDGQLHRSGDYALTFAALGSPLPDDFAARSFAVAAARPSVIYVIGGVLGQQGGTLLTSANAGNSWAPRPLPDGPEGTSPSLITVSPVRPEEIVLSFAGVQRQPEALWISRNGGADWVRLFEGSAELSGVAYSPDAARLLFGGAEDGLWSVSPDDAAAVPTLVSPRPTWGLSWTGAGLFMGLDALRAKAAEESPGELLGLSRDEGSTLASSVRLCDLQPPACPAAADALVRCAELSVHFFEDFVEPMCDQAPRQPWDPVSPTGPGESAGGAAIEGEVRDVLRIESGCAVGPGGRTSPPAGVAVMSAVALVLLGRRRTSQLRPWSEPPSRC